MTNATDILVEVNRRRISLTPNGSRLVVKSTSELPLDFEQVLIRHKVEILAELTLALNLARRVLAGEWRDCDAAEFNHAIRTLSANALDPECLAAIRHLQQAAERTSPNPPNQKTQKHQ